jgi:hypothetical protein
VLYVKDEGNGFDPPGFPTRGQRTMYLSATEGASLS